MAGSEGKGLICDSHAVVDPEWLACGSRHACTRDTVEVIKCLPVGLFKDPPLQQVDLGVSDLKE
jgi:hypothetical protein